LQHLYRRLASHPGLSARLQSLLPPGTNLQTAAAWFKNRGQFVAAVHVSHNLGIPFEQLKAKMTGTSPESLGRAIEKGRNKQIRTTRRRPSPKTGSGSRTPAAWSL
jgi:hypothetical protein